MRPIFKYISSYTIIFFVIFVAGIILRLYKFPEVPGFTDEIRESLMAWDIYKFKHFPITNYSDYIGSIYLYLLAIFMWITPTTVWTPRIFVLLLGIATIPLAYLMGERWGNKRIGLITSLYVSLSPTLIILNSRISWSNCLTPLFTVISMIQLDRAIKKINYKNVILLGLIIGVTAQLHPLMLLFAGPVLGIYSLFLIYKLRFSKELFLDLLVLGAGFCIGVLPIIIVNILNPGASFDDGVGKEHFSYESLTPTFSEYMVYLSREVAQVKHLLRHSIIFDRWVIPEYKYYGLYKVKHVHDLLVILAGFGLVYIYKVKKWSYLFPYLLIGIFLVLAPLITTDYFDGLKIRYYAFLIPLFGLVIGYGLEMILNIPKIHKSILQIIYFALILVMIFVPIRNLSTFSFYEPFQFTKDGLQNDISYLREISKSNNVYYIDPAFRDEGKQYNLVEYLMKFGGINLNNVYKVNNEYIVDDVNVIIFPQNVILHEYETLRDIVINNQVKLIYDGAYFDVYR